MQRKENLRGLHAVGTDCYIIRSLWVAVHTSDNAERDSEWCARLHLDEPVPKFDHM